MKRIIMFLLLFAALKVAGQTTGYLRFDTVKIMKQNGTCELYIINKTKDSLGLLTNVGGGLTRFIKPKKLNDSTLSIGLDTFSLIGTRQRFGLEDDTASSNRFFDLVGNSLRIDSAFQYLLTTKTVPSGVDKGLYNRIELDKQNMYFMVSPSTGPGTRSYGFSAHASLSQMFAAGHVSGHSGYVQADTTQVLLESDPNRLEVRHDSVTLSNIEDGEIDFRIRTLPATVDTNTVKPVGIGALGRLYKLPGWPGSGGGGGAPAGMDREIQINNSGAFGAVTGVKITTQKTIYGDSLNTFKMNVRGDSTYSDKIVFTPSKNKPGSSPAMIGYGEDNNAYDTDTTVNNTLEFKIGPKDGAAGAYIRLGLEKRWRPFPGAGYYWMEAHLPEVRLVDGSVYRPASWTGKETGDDGTWTHRANLHSFYDWDGQKSLGGFSRGAGELITYHNFSGNGVTEMSIRDTGTAVRAAGLRINGQIAGGNRANTTDIYGQTIDWAWETAPIFTATAPGANSSNFNYTFKIPSSNTGHMLIIGKGSSVFDNVFFWMHNDGRVVAGDAGNFFSSYKFQAKSGTNSFVSGDFDANNTTILYSGAFAHRLTSGAGASGMGAGFRFEADNASNTQTVIADIAAAWSGTPTAGAENGDIILRTPLNGTLTESARSKSTGEFSIGANSAYNATTWNGSLEVPTKDAVRDKLETMVSSLNSQTGAVTITAGTAITTSTLSGDITIGYNRTSSDVPHTLANYLTDVNNSGTSETDLYNTTVGANKLNSNGQSIHFVGTVAENDITATTQIRVYFAGTEVANTGGISISGTGYLRIAGEIIRTTSTTARASFKVEGNGLTTDYVNEIDLTGLDFTTTNVFKVTGTAGGGGGGSNDITAKLGKLTFQSN